MAHVTLRYIRKQRKNVIDPRAVSIFFRTQLRSGTTQESDADCAPQVAVRKKLGREREERRKARAIANGAEQPAKPSALDRFKRPS